MTTFALIFLTLFTSTSCWANQFFTGEYIVKLKIGNTLFLDELILNQDASITTGVYKVPGSFESDVLDFQSNQNDFSFEILVKERGESYQVTFRGSFMNENNFSGNAYFSADSSILGEFIGVRK